MCRGPVAAAQGPSEEGWSPCPHLLSLGLALSTTHMGGPHWVHLHLGEPLLPEQRTSRCGGHKDSREPEGDQWASQKTLRGQRHGDCSNPGSEGVRGDHPDPGQALNPETLPPSPALGVSRTHGQGGDAAPCP
jgi:hypothetical protein